ncbi:unnamed protein product [Orchesella dallaii]|uniref:C2H2-type domain-containing protein n=1 Tax=Orchesella dallaii TaxID=48710 RepID=A0ABP1S660_9HEXA
MSTIPTRRSGRIPIKRSYAFSGVDGSGTSSSESEAEWVPPKIEVEDAIDDDDEFEYDVPDEDPLALSSLDESEFNESKKVVKKRTTNKVRDVRSRARKNAAVKIRIKVEDENNKEASQASLKSTSASRNVGEKTAPSVDEELSSDVCKNDLKGTKQGQSDVQENVQEPHSSSNPSQEDKRKRKKEYDKRRYQNMTDEERERRVALKRLRRQRKKRLVKGGDEDTNDDDSFDSCLELESDDECGDGQDEKQRDGTSEEKRQQKRERERLRYQNMSKEERARRLELKRLRRQRRNLGLSCDDIGKQSDKKTDEKTGTAKSRKRKVTMEQLIRRREKERIRYQNMTEEQRAKRVEAQRQRRLQMTPEELEALRLRRRNMTAEEIAQDDEQFKFQQRMQWYLARHAKLATMTEEERKQEQRDIYLGRYAKKVMNETPEQRQERLERQREKYRQKRLNMTPEQQHRFRGLVRNWMTKNGKIKKYSEMSEEDKEKMRAFQREKLKQETPEQRERRLARYKRNTERRRILITMQDEGMSKEEADNKLRISRPDLYPDPAQTGVKKGRQPLPPGATYQYKPKAPYKSAPGRKPTVTQEELEAYLARRERRKNRNQSESQENEPSNSNHESEITSEFTSELPGPQPSHSPTIISSNSPNDVSATPGIEDSEATHRIENAELGTTSENIYVINSFTISNQVSHYSDQASETNGREISQNDNAIEFKLEFTTVDPQETIFLVPEGTEVSNIYMEAVDTNITSPVASPFGGDHECHDGDDDDSQSLHEINYFDAKIDSVSDDLQSEVALPSGSSTNVNEGEQSKVQDIGKEITLKVKNPRLRPEVSEGIEPSEYFCEVCGKVFKSKRYFNEHMEAQHSEERKIFRCPHEGCDKEFRLSVYVLRHFYQVHASDSRLRKNYSTTEAKDETNVETEATVCPYCGKCLNCATGLAKHIYNIHEYNPEKAVGFMCQHCSRTFKEKCTLDDHIRRIHLGMDNKCDICGRTFQSPMKLWKHKVDAHDMKDLDPSSVSSKIKIVECEHCGVKLFRGMKTHIQNEHPEHLEAYMKCHKKPAVSREKRLKYEMKRRNNPLVCIQCNKSFTRTYGYRIHMKKFHILPLISADEKNPFNCEKCQKTFVSEKQLVKHILTKHAKLSDIRVFWVGDDEVEKLKLCQFCQAPQLNNHLYKVHLYDKHVEDILNRFKKSVDEEKNRVERQDLSTHTCPYCDRIKKTTDLGMVSHIRQKHPGESYEKYLNKQPKPNKKDATSTKVSRRIKTVKKGGRVKKMSAEDKDDIDINIKPSRKSSRVRTLSRRYRNEESSEEDNASVKRRRRIQFEKLLVPSAPVELTLGDKKLLNKYKDISWHIPVVLLQKLKDVELPKPKFIR